MKKITNADVRKVLKDFEIMMPNKNVKKFRKK